MLKPFFKFKLCIDYSEIAPDYKDTIFTALLVAEEYVVSWHEEGEKQSTDYSKDDVKDAIDRGLWVIQ